MKTQWHPLASCRLRHRRRRRTRRHRRRRPVHRSRQPPQQPPLAATCRAVRRPRHRQPRPSHARQSLLRAKIRFDGCRSIPSARSNGRGRPGNSLPRWLAVERPTLDRRRGRRRGLSGRQRLQGRRPLPQRSEHLPRRNSSQRTTRRESIDGCFRQRQRQKWRCRKHSSPG